MNDRVRIDIDGPLATVNLIRADKHNAMDFPMLNAVNGAIRTLRRDRSIRAVILRGEGPSFCSGIDFKAILATPAKAAAGMAQLWSPRRNSFQTWSMGWRDIPVPVIAAIHGNCFGAGIQLALGADIRIATPDAKLSIMESKWGLVPDMGGAALLRELVRIDLAKELTMTGRILSGTEAQQLGLVTHVSEDPLDHARRLVAEISARSPDAVGGAKFLMQEAWDASESGALTAERRRQRQLIGSKNQRIAIKRNLEKKDLPYGPQRVRS